MRPRQAERGSVLVLTLWIAAGLAAGAVIAGHAALLRYRREANAAAALQARHAVEAARRYVEAVLGTVGTPGELPAVEDYTAADLAIGPCRVWILGRAGDPQASEPIFALTDEASALNLNTATLEMLEAIPGMTAELAAAIIDWRDTDSDVTANGAESETYLALDPAYVAKDAPFETVDEVRLLNGAESVLLEGRDLNRNGIIEAWESERAEVNRNRFQEIPDAGILDVLTVSSREPNTSAEGRARTDLNGNPMQVRQALIDLFGGRGATMAVTGGIGTTRFRSVLEFCLRVQIAPEEAEPAFDRLTVDSGSVIRGRVNVNTAPVVVLACIPGVGEDSAETLKAYREQNPDSLKTPMWVAEALGPEAAVAAGPYITTKSYQVTADIVAVAPSRRAFWRSRFIIDLSSGTPVTISRRDLTHLGWPLGDALREETALPALSAVADKASSPTAAGRRRTVAAPSRLRRYAASTLSWSGVFTGAAGTAWGRAGGRLGACCLPPGGRPGRLAAEEAAG